MSCLYMTIHHVYEKPNCLEEDGEGRSLGPCWDGITDNTLIDIVNPACRALAGVHADRLGAIRQWVGLKLIWLEQVVVAGWLEPI